MIFDYQKKTMNVYTTEKLESKLYYMFIKTALLKTVEDKDKFDEFIADIKLKKNQTLKNCKKVDEWLSVVPVIQNDYLLNLNKYYDSFVNRVIGDIELMNIMLNPDGKWVNDYDLTSHRYATVTHNEHCSPWTIYSNSNSPNSPKSPQLQHIPQTPRTPQTPHSPYYPNRFDFHDPHFIQSHSRNLSGNNVNENNYKQPSKHHTSKHKRSVSDESKLAKITIWNKNYNYNNNNNTDKIIKKHAHHQSPICQPNPEQHHDIINNNNNDNNDNDISKKTKSNRISNFFHKLFHRAHVQKIQTTHHHHHQLNKRKISSSFSNLFNTTSKQNLDHVNLHED